MSENLCKICKKVIIGRTDKLFCSKKCKNAYHIGLSKFVRNKTIAIDKILHRNRAILQEVLGKKIVQIKVKRLELSKRKFDFKYHTHFHINKSGKMYHHVYDLAWMVPPAIGISDDEILIISR